MTVKITRLELTPAELRGEAAGTKDAGAARRMLAIALLLEGRGREAAARQSAMDRQTLRDWVHRYNAEGIAGLSDRLHGGGAPRKLTAAQENEVAGWVRTGPVLETDGVVRWRRSDLGRKTAATFGVHLHERSVGKLLHRLGFRHLSVRPRHPQADPSTQEAHKKITTLVADAIPPEASGKPIELWWQDEARIGQQGGLTYVWGKQGTRPSAPRDQRSDWAYIFGAVCPARGVGAALVLPEANAEAMNLHLTEISRHVSPGAHAVVLLDGAGWHQLGGSCVCRTISACCTCRPTLRNSIRWRTSGSF